MRLAMIGVSLMLTAVLYEVSADTGTGQVTLAAFALFISGKVALWLGLWSDWREERHNEHR